MSIHFKSQWLINRVRLWSGLDHGIAVDVGRKLTRHIITRCRAADSRPTVRAQNNNNNNNKRSLTVEPRDTAFGRCHVEVFSRGTKRLTVLFIMIVLLLLSFTSHMYPRVHRYYWMCVCVFYDSTSVCISDANLIQSIILCAYKL